MIESVFQSKSLLNGLENLINDIKDTKIYSDFIKIVHEFLQKLYEYFDLFKKWRYQVQEQANNERTSMYVTSSNVFVNPIDENDELNQKLIDAKITEKKPMKKNSIIDKRKNSSIHIISERNLSPKEFDNHRRFFSPVVNNEDLKKNLNNKERKDEKIEENSKGSLQKNIKGLKSEISKLIWEEERRVIFNLINFSLFSFFSLIFCD